jgi:8-oxo-dGTP pyrophosphatase MutT (NUDIX family)
MRVGESPVQTAIRKTSQELNLHGFDVSRLHYVGTYSTCFAFRHQLPQDHGAHTLNVTYCAELTAIEKEQILLHPNEHETWQWFTVEQVGDLLKLDDETDQEMDKALWRVILDVKRRIFQGSYQDGYAE